MFQIPFHIDKPLAVGLFLLPVIVLFFYLRIRFNNEESRFRKVMEFLLDKWSVQLEMEKKLGIFRGYLTSMLVIFGAMFVFSFTVGVGIIKNGDRPEPDIAAFEQRMREQGLQKRTVPELERLKEKYELKSSDGNSHE